MISALMKKLQNILKNALTIFALITIGFALGKAAAKRSAGAPAPEPATDARAGVKVSVIYAHTTFRCVTCNTIETLARQTVENRFAEELAEGIVDWHTVNFQEDKAFADRYGIVSSTLIVARADDGAETGFRRLDEVWTRYQDPEAFEAYVAGAIRAALSAPPGEFK